MSTTAPGTTATPRERVPRIVPVLAASIFVLGTSEFLITGLLPDMAVDLGVSIPQVGYLISAFAVGMIVGAPAMAVLTLRLPRRTTLVTMLLVVIATHAVGALAASYGLLLVLGTTSLYQAGMVGMLAYVAPLLTEVTGLAPGWVPVVQLGFGLGSFVGVTIGGRVADAHPWTTLFSALVAAAVLLGVLGLTAGTPAAAVPLIVALGLIAFVAAAPLNSRVFALAGSAPTLASATNTSAFNVGNSLGPALGGLAISAGWGFTAPSLIGVGLIAGAVALGTVSWSVDRRRGAVG
ncbi:MFS transporter [Pseudonocardia sediminis]|uniref:MFS transporter n=1 Tax=Pseudonocardia sediminis TaxID=1397368 RepID=A0A4V2FRA1_PSEST|nr:MFS transporter [Pseudonocardia sediminis]RZT87730.1 MFS transporter [Pseudonocardia sediminis]